MKLKQRSSKQSSPADANRAPGESPASVRKRAPKERRHCRTFLYSILIGTVLIHTWFSVHVGWKNERRKAESPTVDSKIIVVPHNNDHAENDSRQGKEQLTTQEKESALNAPYAYAWVLGAIDEDRPAYKGFFYDILISVHLLKKLGSQADFYLIAQLYHDSVHNELPADDVRLLTSTGIKILLLEKPQKSSFANLVYEKFRPLQFTQYRRIMFLDADTIPLVNLDYLFHLSEEPDAVLRPNLIMASLNEPCNTGLFIMSPEPGAWEELQEVIQRQHDIGQSLPYPHFDWQTGWGHSFRKEGDFWEAVQRNGTAWRFHAGHSDQGLWYYFAKYVKQDVSIVIGNRLQTVSRGKDGKPRLENAYDVLSAYQPKPIANQYRCSKKSSFYKCNPVYLDFAHFMGDRKPWNHPPACEVCDGKLSLPHKLWYKELAEINDKLSIGLDVENFTKKHMPQIKDSPLGYLAKFSDKSDHVKSHAKSQDVPVTVAYALSFIKCGDFQTHSAGLTDASLVLRHSVHKISRRNPASGSKYDYKMYAIVHRDAAACTEVLRETGFEVVIVDPPVNPKEIQGEYLRKNIHREWCCGSDEFIKLYAYTLPEEIVVHTDIDFAFLKPLDDLFDSMRFDRDSPEGQAARKKLLLERATDELPEKISVFFTRDWPQVAPNKWPAGYQAGFMVAKRDPVVFEEMKAVILEGNYAEGWGWKSGWGGLGYGGWVGAMAMQGFIAYFYDHVRPNTAVELNQCRFNHMGMDTLYRGPPSFRKNNPGVGHCRNGAEECEDCMTTDMEKIYSVHYTYCRKPWQCMAIGHSGGRVPEKGRATAINTDSVHLDHCLELVRHWHDLRVDFEEQLFQLTNDIIITSAVNGTYRPEIFRGHCDGDGNEHYKLIAANKETFRRVSELYEPPGTASQKTE